MPLPVITDTYRCTLNWERAQGVAMHNVMHFRVSTGSEGDVFTVMDECATPGMWASTPTGFAVSSVDIIKLDGLGVTHNFPTGSPAHWTGSGSGDWIPASCAIITLRTGIRGRSNRGRLYLPMAEGDQDNGLISSGVLNTLQTEWTAFQECTETHTQSLVVASYRRTIAHSVTSVTAQPACGTQRRRQSALR